MPPPQTPATRQTRDIINQDRQRAQLSTSTRRSQAAPAAPSSQFAPTPRFNFTASSSRRPATQTRPRSSSSPLATRNRIFKSQPAPEDDIDDDDDDDDEAATSGLGKDIRRSIEDVEQDEMLLDALEEQQQQQQQQQQPLVQELKRRHASTSPPAPRSPEKPARKRAQQEPIVVSSSPELEIEPEADELEIRDSEEDPDGELPSSPLGPAPQVEISAAGTSALPINAVSLIPPQTPARASTAPRFKFTPATSTHPRSGKQPVSSTLQLPLHPQFIIPSQADLQPSTSMLPLLFSPQKRGQRYIPGGLAETVRDWALEAGGHMMLNEPRRISISKVEEVGPAGARLVEGEYDNGSQGEKVERFLLVGADDSGTQTDVRVGDTVAARLGWQWRLDETGRSGAEHENEDTRQGTWQVAWGPV